MSIDGPIEEEYDHKGVNVRIYRDDDPQNPRTEYDQGTTIVAWHRRSDIGDKDYNYRNIRHALDAIGATDELIEWLKVECGALVVKPLYLFEHSGQTISLTPFGDPWDSGQVGFVFVTQEHLNLTGCALDDAEALIESDVAEYDNYLRGEVYGYIVDESGDNEESCWGFIGDVDYAKQEANMQAGYVAEQREKEAAEAAHWAARDTVTV